MGDGGAVGVGAGQGGDVVGGSSVDGGAADDVEVGGLVDAVVDDADDGLLGGLGGVLERFGPGVELPLGRLGVVGEGRGRRRRPESEGEGEDDRGQEGEGPRPHEAAGGDVPEEGRHRLKRQERL